MRIRIDASNEGAWEAPAVAVARLEETRQTVKKEGTLAPGDAFKASSGMIIYSLRL